MKKPFADIVRESAGENLRRLTLKLPEWAPFASDLIVPSRLSCEQCSSSRAAAYKSRLACRIVGQVSGTRRNSSSSDCVSEEATVASELGRLADLSGGIGADSWAFASAGFSVFYNEMRADIAGAAKHNFELLGFPGIIVHNSELQPGGAASLLGDFVPDIIYLDPARRNETGGKVFRLEDCSPNLLLLKDELLHISRHLLVKLSPMADIALICSQLGNSVREVHIVGANGECKELLLWMDRDYEGSFEIVCGDLRFTTDMESLSVAEYCASEDDFVGKYLYEPSACVLKAGCFKLLCGRFGLRKVGVSTQLYVADSIDGGLYGNGKFFTIKHIVPFGGKTLSALAKEYPRCEVTARNLPISSDGMRSRMKNTSGGNIHLFACRADFSSGKSSRLVLICERVTGAAARI